MICRGIESSCESLHFFYLHFCVQVTSKLKLSKNNIKCIENSKLIPCFGEKFAKCASYKQVKLEVNMEIILKKIAEKMKKQPSMAVYKEYDFSM